jgi:ribose transport system permease protein
LSVIERYGTAIAGLAMIVFFAAAADNFTTPGNLLNVAKDTGALAVLAIGFALALTIAELDLSIADVASLAAVVAGWCIQAGLPPAMACLAGSTASA